MVHDLNVSSICICSGNKCMSTMGSCSRSEVLESLVEAPTPSSVLQTVLFVCAACVYLIINIHLYECFTDFYMLISNQLPTKKTLISVVF